MLRLSAPSHHQVTGGEAVVKAVEAVGSNGGRTAKKVVIADCGELKSKAM